MNRAAATIVALTLAGLLATPAAAQPLTTRERAQRAVERYAVDYADGDSYAVDQCRVGTRRAKCRLREWGKTDQLPWVPPPVTDYEAEYTAVVRRVRGRLVVHLAGVCVDGVDRSPACDY